MEPESSCDCCEEQCYRSPDDAVDSCFYCHHVSAAHREEYTGPLGTPYEWTS